jgi:hypothetical protein
MPPITGCREIRTEGRQQSKTNNKTSMTNLEYPERSQFS